ncbi:MAG: hypothetical protein HN696_07290 [Euryarchaeota archaeon]|nr:hypothetical protein [Euryarchaeota archaeon]
MVSNRAKAIAVVFVMMLMYSLPAIQSSSSGKFNTANGCGSCHGGSTSSSVTPTHDFPSSYNPSQTYSVNIGINTAISGTKGGFSLEVNKGTLSNAGTNAKISGSSATHSNSNSRSWTVDWTAPTVGGGNVNVALAVNAVDGTGDQSGDFYSATTHSISETIQPNNAPSASSLLLTPANPGTLDDLVASYTYFDSDGDLQSGSTISWNKDGAPQSSLSNLVTVPASSTSKGEEWSFSITPSDGEDFGSTQVSAIVTIANTAPSVLDASITPSDANENTDLTAAFNFTDADEDSTSVESIRWYLGGVLQPSSNDATTVSSIATRVGDEWYYDITPTDSVDTGQTFSSTTIIIGSSNTAPIADSVLLAANGDGDTNSDLTASWTFNDVDVGQVEDNNEIQWFKGASYMPIHDDLNPLPNSATNKGDEWSFKVRVSDGMLWSEWTSSNVVIIQNSPPRISNLKFIGSESSINSSQNLEVTWDFIDDDEEQDGTQGVPIVNWTKNGVNYDNSNWFGNSQVTSLSVGSAATTRGDIWGVTVTPFDEFDYGQEYYTEVEIMNSNPTIFSFEYLPKAPTTMDNISFGFDYTDVDDDSITVSVNWQDSSGSISSEDILDSSLTTTGGTYYAIITITDGNGGMINYTSTSIEVVNSLPTAIIEVDPGSAWAGVNLSLSGEPSFDFDGDIIAWYWTIGNTSYEGAGITIPALSSETTATLVVIDNDGGQANTSVQLAIIEAPSVTGLKASSSGIVVSLTWDAVEGTNVTYKVFRSFEPITENTDLSSLELMEETSNTSWTASSILMGEIYHAVAVLVDGEESMIISDGMSTSIDVSLPALETWSHPSKVEGGLIVTLLMLIAAGTVILLAFVEKMSGGES